MKIAVDAMGGDNAPQAVVEGAVQAAKEYGHKIFLVGLEQAISEELAKYNLSDIRLEIVPASQVVEMHESPVAVLRQKKDSSLVKAISLLKEGSAQALVTAGNTGAAMACATIHLRAIQGVERPAIATVLPTLHGYSLLLDAGANVDCKPFHLLQFAIMGHIYTRDILGIEDPKVGLLNIGEEEGKGNELTKQAFELLKGGPFNFVGNVDGKRLYSGFADVIVCDGFVGNVALKTSEAVAEAMVDFFRREVESNWRNKLGFLFLRPALRKLKRRMDYAEYGGAPLLGVNGAIVIAHGASGAKAIKNAVRVAGEVVKYDVNRHIEDNIVRRGKLARFLNRN